MRRVRAGVALVLLAIVGVWYVQSEPTPGPGAAILLTGLGTWFLIEWAGLTIGEKR